MAQILYASGDVKNVEPKNGKDFQYEELKEIVGGYIEIVYLSDKQIMVVNEEGKLIGLPFYLMATEAYRLATQPNNDTIVGDVLLCDVNQVK